MNTQSLLRESIVKTLVNDIAENQTIYCLAATPAFIRIEGGMKRQFFNSQTPHLLRENFVQARTNIERLFTTEELKKQLLDIFDRLLPGTCLIVLDSDSEFPDARISDWFIVSV